MSTYIQHVIGEEREMKTTKIVDAMIEVLQESLENAPFLIDTATSAKGYEN